MREEAILKINKIGKVSTVFATIGKIFVGVCLVITLACSIFLLCMPKNFMNVVVNEKVEFVMDLSVVNEQFDDEDMKDLKEGITTEDDIVLETKIEGDKVKLSGEDMIGNFDLRKCAYVTIAVSITLILLMVSLCFGGSLCKSFRDCQSPFEENVIVKMRRFAFSLIPWALVSTLSQSVSNSVLNNKISINFVVDFGIILIVLAVFVLVYIFQYGAVLQQESDETL